MTSGQATDSRKHFMSYPENMIFQLGIGDLWIMPLYVNPDVRITAGRSRVFLEPYPHRDFHGFPIGVRWARGTSNHPGKTNTFLPGTNGPVWNRRPGYTCDEWIHRDPAKSSCAFMKRDRCAAIEQCSDKSCQRKPKISNC